MRLLSLFFVLLAVCALAQTPASAPAKPADAISSNVRIQPAPEKFAFPEDQTLVYDVEWRLWRAGQATIRIEPAGAEKRLYGTADSAGFVALLYRVRDRFETFFDAKTLCSRQITKNIEEGGRRRSTTIRFDAQRGKAVLDEKDLKKNTTKHVENDAPACATDVLSGMFYVATQPLRDGDIYTFPLNDGGKTVDVKVTVEAREKVKTPAGEFAAIRTQPESLGLLKNKGNVWIWYSDDERHLPVQMRSKLFWGTLTFRLARIDRDKK